MVQRMSLDQLHNFLANAGGKVNAVARELSEVQVAFVSAHQTSKEAHDATLADLSDRAAQSLDSLPADIRQAITQRLEIERKTLADRRQELAKNVVPQAEYIADGLLARAQEETERIRQLNPRLDSEEERLKAERAQMEIELTRLNTEIKKSSGCVMVFINFFKINALDRERQKLLGRMEENAHALRQVREEWEKTRSEYDSEGAQLRQQWERASIDAARAREEMAQLNDHTTRDNLALRRAIFHVFDNWKTPPPADGSSSPLASAINQMVELNVQTDTYQEGLGKVAGLIALMNGIGQGLTSLDQSVQALISEQSMHSSYLSPITINVDDSVIEFHRQWDSLQGKLRDEKALAGHPVDFSALFDREIEGSLSKDNITRTFNSLGTALQAATQNWKG